jgi:hypothetical protein
MSKSNKFLIEKPTYKVDGFRFNTQLFDRMKACMMPSSSWVVYLTLLSEVDQKGIIQDYSLSEWASTLNISYNTLYKGFRLLVDCHFVTEVIINDLPYLKINEYEELNRSFTVPSDTSGKKSLNYFKVPRSIFDKGILKELVRSNHVRGITFIFTLLNRFRVAIKNGNTQAVLPYLMPTLKRELKKREAKSVREYMELLADLFEVEAVGVEIRKNQVRVEKYIIKLRNEHIVEPEIFNFKQLLAKYGESLSDFLYTHGFRHSKKDTRDILIAFRQEVLNRVIYFEEEKGQVLLRDIFLSSLHGIEKQKKQVPDFSIKTLGAYFRTTFRTWTKSIVGTDTNVYERVNAETRRLGVGV